MSRRGDAVRVLTRPARALALTALVLAAWPAAAEAQIFIASRPHPEFTIGPLFVRASVDPTLGPVALDIFFSLVIPPDRSAADLEQDIFLLWPGELIAEPDLGAPDPALKEYVEQRGFIALGEGRVAFLSRSLYDMSGKARREPLPGGAPFVTFVRQGGALGLTSPVSFVKIPWTPRLANPAWMMSLKMRARGMIKDKPGTWVEHTFWGVRHRLSLSFHEVRSRALFPMYFQHRDRIIRLADEPAQLLVDFADSDHLKIDELSPPASKRQLSETRDKTETVSLYLERSQSLTPQTLTVQFGYFRGMQSWAPILIPALFFLLGNLAAPILRDVGRRLAHTVTARIHVGRRGDTPPRERGVILERDTLARIMPGQTTYAELIRLCGPNFEQHEQLAAPNRRTLVYRGRRAVPERRRTFGWLATVDHWAVEHHEVEIDLDGDQVSNVQARVRRSRMDSPEET
jgi:hypothetical protein